MIKIKTIMLLVLAAILSSCSEKQKKNSDTLSEINETEVSSQEKRLQRKMKGDTLALNYKELQKYLPEEINGYTVLEIPEGESVEIPGMSFSLAEKKYKKGESELVISLYDYNGAYDMYAGATALFSKELTPENDHELTKVVLVNNKIKAWESYRKKEKKSELRMGIGERFYVNIKADKQEGTEEVKKVAEKLDLNALNNL